MLAWQGGGPAAALGVLGRRSGGQFDPSLVDMVMRAPDSLLAALASRAVGADGVRARVGLYQDAVAGQWDVQDVFSVGDRVAVRWIGPGRHEGELMGLDPTGAPIEVDAISLFRVAGGKTTEERTVWDALGLLQQVGAVPVPARVPAALTVSRQWERGRPSRRRRAMRPCSGGGRTSR